MKLIEEGEGQQKTVHQHLQATKLYVQNMFSGHQSGGPPIAMAAYTGSEAVDPLTF